MNYVGDIRLGDTIDVKFCTVSTTGAPTTLAGTPSVAAYPGNSTTEITAGITLSVDFDARTGMHNVRVVATSGNGYATATNYALVITAGTVGGTSVVGYVIGEFSIENRSALMPTTAARTLDVNATGEAGVDWANVGSPTTTLALTGTTIATTQQVDVNTIKTQAVTAAAGVTFPSSIASPTNITAGTITTVTNLTNAPTAGDFTAAMKTSIGTAVAASAVASVTGNVGGNVVGSVGSVTGLTASNLDATVSSRLASAAYTAPLDAAGTRTAVGLASANLDTQLSTIAGFIDTEVASILSDTGTIKAKTNNLPASPASTTDVTGLLTTQLTQSYAADGVAPTLTQALFAIQQFLQERAVAGTTLTVKKLDGSTTAMTFTLDDGTNPTSITRAT